MQLPNDNDPIGAHSLSPRELKELLAAERIGKAFLAFRDPRGALSTLPLDPLKTPRTIGRREEMDLPISWDDEVSGLHAEVLYVQGEWMIIDDGLSTNGTYVNGERTNGRRRLRHGDRIRVGHTVLAYDSAGASAPKATVSAGGLAARPHLTDSQRSILVALCRPYRHGGTFATPASNQQIADEVFLSTNAVKMHLRMLFGKFELGGLPQNEKRARLAEYALQSGLISLRDLD
jgi:DNA-binding CsgD family transcriptional regulator